MGFFGSRAWISAGAAAAGAFGFPYPLECLTQDRPPADGGIDWDEELRKLLAR